MNNIHRTRSSRSLYKCVVTLYKLDPHSTRSGCDIEVIFSTSPKRAWDQTGDTISITSHGHEATPILQSKKLYKNNKLIKELWD